MQLYPLLSLKVFALNYNELFINNFLKEAFFKHFYQILKKLNSFALFNNLNEIMKFNKENHTQSLS